MPLEALARAARREPPPPPLRARPANAGRAAELATGSLPPPPIPSRFPPPPPVRKQASAPPPPLPRVQRAVVQTSAQPVQTSAEPVASAPLPEQPRAHQSVPPPAAPPPPNFRSTGSEMPVVITTPPPRMRPSVASNARLFAARAQGAQRALLSHARTSLPRVKALGSRAAALLPRAKRVLPEAKRLLRPVGRVVPAVRRALPLAAGWAQRTVRSTPRALLLSAPFVLLLSIWLVHGLASHHRPAVHAAAQPAQVNAPAASQAAFAPAPPTRGPSDPAPISAALTAAGAIPAPPAIADDAELRQALTQGLPAMEGLAARYAADPQVLVALAGVEAQAQRYEAAIATIESALEAGPSATQNGKIMSILWRAAQSPAAEESFTCLRKLGARGNDVEFDLAVTPGVREAVRERAKTELSNFMALDASNDTRAAASLMLAPDCETRKALLDRAEQDGGKRTLVMLQRLAQGGVCSSSSDAACNSCLEGSPVLTQAIAKLNAGGKP
jgi:hypothetical protein